MVREPGDQEFGEVDGEDGNVSKKTERVTRRRGSETWTHRGMISRRG